MESLIRPALLAALSLALPIAAYAEQLPPAEMDPTSATMQRITSARWSLISPDKDYEGGCVVGFLAFEFSPTGYFVYNNRIRGSWRLDELGNIKLRTKDGVLLTLMVEGTTMRPSRNFAFLKRAELYQKCNL